MPAKIDDIADAVKVAIDAETFSQSFTAERLNLPIVDLADVNFDGWKVTVVPHGRATLPGDRRQSHFDYLIDVGVQKKLGTAAEAIIDAGKLLVDEIDDVLDRAHFPSVGAHWLGTTIDPIFVPEHAEQLGQFTSVLVARYRVFGG